MEAGAVIDVGTDLLMVVSLGDRSVRSPRSGRDHDADISGPRSEERRVDVKGLASVQAYLLVERRR
jgi:hypothetical protein